MRRCATPNMNPRCIATNDWSDMADDKEPPPESKLTRSKERWARAGKFLTGKSSRREEARFVVLHSHDGYTTNLALEDFAAEDALLAHSWSGQPLEQEHGGPVRLVVPHLYFWKSAKWLQSIEFLAEDAPGYWEVRGYHNRGDPWKEERYSAD